MKKLAAKIFSLALVLLLCAANVGAQQRSLRAKVGTAMKILKNPQSPDSTLAAALDTVALADTLTYRQLCGYAEQLLDNPNSPLHNEQRLIVVLQSELRSEASDVAMRSRAADRLKLALANRPGTVAKDFEMLLTDGSSTTLHELTAPLILLFLGDPSCHACGKTASWLQRQEAFTGAVRSGRLMVVAVAVTPSEAEWRSRLAELPAEWTAALDKWNYISDGLSYDLRALPTLCLLDSGHRVVLKDPRPEQLVRWLQQNP